MLPDPPLPRLRATRAAMLEHHIRCGTFTDLSTGIPILTRKVIILKFGDVIAEAVDEDILDGQGRPMERVDIRGYFCDPNLQAVEEEWTEEDIGFVRADIDRRLAEPQFTHFVIWEAPKPVLPWASYDDMQAGRIAPFAEEAGLLAEAMDYESRTKARESVMKTLEAKLEKLQAAEALTAT